MSNFRDGLTFRNYDRNRIVIDSIAARLSEEENAFRNRIINSIADNHTAFRPSGGAESAMVEALRSKNALALEEDGSVSSIYPVSARPSRHLAALADGRTVYCMCAIRRFGLRLHLQPGRRRDVLLQQQRRGDSCCGQGRKNLLRAAGQRGHPRAPC